MLLYEWLMFTLRNTSRNHGNCVSPLYLTVQFGSRLVSFGKMLSPFPPMLV